MKKLFLAAALLAMPFATGCGSSACDDYEDAINECCDKAGEGVECSFSVPEDADDDACEAANDAFTCPF